MIKNIHFYHHKKFSQKRRSDISNLLHLYLCIRMHHGSCSMMNSISRLQFNRYKKNPCHESSDRIGLNSQPLS